MARFAKQHRHLAYRGAGYDVGVLCLNHLSASLEYLGYADQALQKSRAMVTLARGLAHPLSLAAALSRYCWTRWRNAAPVDTPVLLNNAGACS